VEKPRHRCGDFEISLSPIRRDDIIVSVSLVNKHGVGTQTHSTRKGGGRAFLFDVNTDISVEELRSNRSSPDEIRNEYHYDPEMDGLDVTVASNGPIPPR